MAEERRALHAYLDVPSHQTLTTFAEENGVSLTGLIEALAMELSAEIDKATTDGRGITDVRRDWVRAARKIDAHRRRRGADR